MPPENEPVNAVATLSTGENALLATATRWLQQTIVVMVLAGHLLLPVCFLFGGEADLLRDSVFLSQVALICTVAILGELSWLGRGVLFVAGTTGAVIWMQVFPPHYYEYALLTFLLPQIVLILCLAIARYLWVRGDWSPASKQPGRPLQISIRSLLVITFFVAATLAGSSWLREAAGSRFTTTYNVLVTLSDGFGTATLCLLATWAIGTRGTSLVRPLMLLCASGLLIVAQTIAFSMEEYWYLNLITWLCWAAITFTTLGALRLAGWHLVVHKRVFK
ncbi:hypothetical protein NA78x_005342 [Anatilimnocola sp. NA78]|uniref:hypothetical protein n=1 Tax=Anatilimnocola sp. NA78 TaxID=3415683 RepID=UPI003CE50845